jgi:MFS-type transporter involved in bile tolerance (Atg22 family)
VVRATVGTVFGSLGLWLESQLYFLAGSHAAVVTWMLPVLALTLVLAWRLPETATRELEQISPER